MDTSVSARCRTCITTLKSIVSTLSHLNRQKNQLHHGQVNDELERFTLWVGNIGAIHPPESTLSLESRLLDSSDVLAHVLESLEDMNEAAEERGSTALRAPLTS
jgi:hypothetical protein